MLSSRERRPGTAGNSNRNQLLLSARSNSRSRPKSSSCQKTFEQLNDPLFVNQKYGSEFKHEGPKFPPTINPNHDRYPTILPNDNLVCRPKRPLTCPAAFIHANLNPSWEESPNYQPIIDGRTRTLASQHFIEDNYEYMREYRPEYRGKSPRGLRTEMVNDKAFCSTMRELKKKECSVKNGTSSLLLRTSLHHKDNDRNNREAQPGSTFDPYWTSIQTSREHRLDKMTRLFMPATREMAHDKTFNRGYQHDSEFKNFSEFNGHLIRNKGTMLER